MKINIYPEVEAEYFEEDQIMQVYSALEVLYEEFETVPEQDSILVIEVDGKEIDLTLIHKKYKLTETALNIILVYKQF